MGLYADRNNMVKSENTEALKELLIQRKLMEDTLFNGVYIENLQDLANMDDKINYLLGK